MDPNNLSTLTAQPTPLKVGDKTYQLHPLTLNDVGKLQAFVDAQFPDPFAVAEKVMSRFNVAQQKHLLAAALELASQPRPQLGTPEADRHLLSIDGIKEVLFITISKGDPTFTREKAAEVLGQMTAIETKRVMESTGAASVVGDPKDSSPTPNGSGTEA